MSKIADLERPSWYLSNVRPKIRHTWSNQEANAVYALRVRRVPVAEILDKLHLAVNKTAVYNIVRMVKKTRNQKCIQCGKPLTAEDRAFREEHVRLNSRAKPRRFGCHFQRCISCLKVNSDLKKKTRRSFRKRGLCGYCGKHKVIPGRTSCKSCISMTYRRNQQKGNCGWCGTPTNHTTLCPKCESDNRINSIIIRAKKKYATH